METLANATSSRSSWCRGCPCTHQEVVTSERSQAFSENKIEECWDQRIMTCSQNEFHANSRPRELTEIVQAQRYKKEKSEVGRIKVPHTASCASPSLQRVKGLPGGNERQERKGAVPGQEDGKDRGQRSRMQPNAQEKEVKSVPSFTSCGSKRQ